MLNVFLVGLFSQSLLLPSLPPSTRARSHGVDKKRSYRTYNSLATIRPTLVRTSDAVNNYYLLLVVAIGRFKIDGQTVPGTVSSNYYTSTRYSCKDFMTVRHKVDVSNLKLLPFSHITSHSSRDSSSSQNKNKET